MNKELDANTNLSHYRIVSKIGAGGMGEVYLAQETRLDRKVALKILPAELAANQDRMRRFVQEAKVRRRGAGTEWIRHDRGIRTRRTGIRGAKRRPAFQIH